MSRKFEVGEVLLHVPDRYVDYSVPSTVFDTLDFNIKQFVRCRLISKTGWTRNRCMTPNLLPYGKNKAWRLSIECDDGYGNRLSASLFGVFGEWADVRPGADILLRFRLDQYNGRKVMSEVELVDPVMMGTIRPHYVGTTIKISSDKLRSAIQADMNQHLMRGATLLMERLQWTPGKFLEVVGVDAMSFLRSLHEPRTLREGEWALMMAHTIAIQGLLDESERNRRLIPSSQSIIDIDVNVIAEFARALPYPLTGDQKTAIQEIVRDLKSNIPMRRLLSGDVGRGKTITFMLPAAVSYLAGARVAIVTANQLLVDQFAREWRAYFPSVPVNPVRPGGSVERSLGVAIGTTSVLFAAKREAARFDLVITDEQQKFSVSQKAALMDEHTNVLEATATPIPRTIAVLMTGGMDVSILRERPVANTIHTMLLGANARARIITFIRERVNAGKQVAVIYPLVTESEDPSKFAIQGNAEKWEKLFPGRIAILHGQMPEDQKRQATESMLSGEKSILVASSAIEVGLTIPDLACMLLVNAEQFGISQAHQLRGRLARHGGEGHMLLFCPDDIEETARVRLQALVECNDGYELAVRDMEMRGFGDMGVTGRGGQKGRGTMVLTGINIPYAELCEILDVETRKRKFDRATGVK